jgi:hypothetical protein
VLELEAAVELAWAELLSRENQAASPDMICLIEVDFRRRFDIDGDVQETERKGHFLKTI